MNVTVILYIIRNQLLAAHSKLVAHQDMRRYIGVAGILTFLHESGNQDYLEELLDICMDELNLIIDKFLFSDDRTSYGTQS